MYTYIETNEIVFELTFIEVWSFSLEQLYKTDTLHLMYVYS